MLWGAGNVPAPTDEVEPTCGTTVCGVACPEWQWWRSLKVNADVGPEVFPNRLKPVLQKGLRAGGTVRKSPRLFLNGRPVGVTV